MRQNYEFSGQKLSAAYFKAFYARSDFEKQNSCVINTVHMNYWVSTV
jgi:hypothetical protein